MAKSEIKVEGVITEALGNSMFRVELTNGHILLCSISGKMRMNYIKVMPGDKVTVEMSPFDLTRGRISARLKAGEMHQTVTIKPKKKK